MYQKGESGNPSGRKKGSLNKRTMAAGAVKREYKSTKLFWDKIAQQANGGCMESLKILVARVEPPYKPRSMPVPVDLGEHPTASEYVPAVLKAIGDGVLAPDEGSALLNALLSGSKLEKLDELEQKVNQLLEMRQS